MLSAITPIYTTYDSDGIDIYFLNHQNLTGGANGGAYTNVTTEAVQHIFNSVQPLNATPTNTHLNHILKPYLAKLEAGKALKPLNIIVTTDGVPTDDVESVIVQAAKKLDAWDAESW